MSPHVSPFNVGFPQGLNTDSGGNRTIGAGGVGIRSAQELKNSIRHALNSTFVVFGRIPVFPLKNISLLAQLLFLLLLSSHQRTVLRILGLQRGDQTSLLCQGLLLFCYMLPCQLQTM
ncbi:Uncharacterised protein [Serratia entomophila]|nr:Uncharacterised protein [Serratia entomophila]